MVASVDAAEWFSAEPISCGQTSQASIGEATMHQSGHTHRYLSFNKNDSFLN